MTNEDKALAIFRLIVEKTYPKEQFGFYTEQMMFDDILKILNNQLR